MNQLGLEAGGAGEGHVDRLAAHAASAYYCSGYERALVFTFDWYGGGLRSPEAIRRLVVHARDQWNTWSVVFVGDANENALGKGVLASGMNMVNLLQPEFVVGLGDLVEGYMTPDGRTADEEMYRTWWAEIDEDLWWLREPRDLAAAKPPLSERLEWSIFSLLSTSGGITRAAFDDRVGRLFRGPETVDAELVPHIGRFCQVYFIKDFQHSYITKIKISNDVVDAFYAGYGDGPPRGTGPDQGQRGDQDRACGEADPAIGGARWGGGGVRRHRRPAAYHAAMTRSAEAAAINARRVADNLMQGNDFILP